MKKRVRVEKKLVEKKKAVASKSSPDNKDIEDLLLPFRFPDFHTLLTSWYATEHRMLPWRGGTPYQVWVSEIMCQQTRVDTVIPYFHKWMKAFPTVQSLAESSLDEVNIVWAGLGYYRRARFLHEGAKVVMKDFNGCVPETKAELLTIPGIGEYTSGAISSICTGARNPAVDGNVLRVVSRLLANSRQAKDLLSLSTRFAQSVLDVDSNKTVSAGDVNQALMELGALVCTPKKPACTDCPVSAHCQARIQFPDPSKLCLHFPRPKPKKGANPIVTLTVCCVVSGDDTKRSVLAMKRSAEGDGLLSNQWELVCASTEAHVMDKLIEMGVCRSCVKQDPTRYQVFDHLFSHLTHRIETIRLDLQSSCRRCQVLQIADQVKWIPLHQLGEAGLTRSMTKALEKCGL